MVGPLECLSDTAGHLVAPPLLAAVDQLVRAAVHRAHPDPVGAASTGSAPNITDCALRDPFGNSIRFTQPRD
ncbi:hypothetical protein [Streptomyces sp. NPDC002133]|uniref:hypothetical protein n=1 Tax=Streptomyces sp. NPDC002133 TaxID=3154409 RepID=UPI00332E0435